VPVRAHCWLTSALCALASVALLGLAASPAGAASSASSASSGRPGDRANVGATHSPEVLSQLRHRSVSAPLTGTGEMGPAALASAAIAGDEQGVDVASFQHPNGAAINWSQVAASGVGFAAVKATEGDYYQNPYALTDLAGAEAAGLSVVAYAFAIPNGNGSSNSPVTQANYLIKYLGSYASTVPVMLDIEYNPYSGGQCYGLKGAKLVAWVAAFDAQVQAKTGRMPIIYTPPAWWNSCTGNSTGFGPDPLWVPSITTGSPVLPDGWANWTVWQYSGTGTVAGINSADTDLDQASAAFLGLLNPGTQDQSDGSPAGLQLQQAIPTPGQTVSYTATGLPPGVSITSAGNLTGWLTRAGTYPVQVSASDPAGATQSLSFSWTVTAATGSGPAGPVRFGVGGKCLNDVGNKSANGTAIDLWTCNGSAAQQWTVASDRSLRIHGKCLSVSGSAKTSGAKEVLQPCSAYASQQWTVSTGAHLVNGTAGLCLSGSASGANGSRVWLGQCATGASRAWTLPAGPVRSQLPGQCVASQTSGSAVVLAPCSSGAAGQQWTAQPDGTVRQSGKCLEVTGAGTASGTDVDLAACSGGPGQQWHINLAGAGQQLANPQSGLCLADPSDRTVNGTQLVIAACTGGDPGTAWRLP
jgi:GH25 family lysozyme M1 (1,4-beta-N-acetylmuramidase)